MATSNNPFDAFDEKPQQASGNPFDAFDGAPVAPAPQEAPVEKSGSLGDYVLDVIASTYGPIGMAMRSDKLPAIVDAAQRSFYQPDIDQGIGEMAQNEAFIANLNSGQPIAYADIRPYMSLMELAKLDLGRSLVGEESLTKSVNSPGFRADLLRRAQERQVAAQKGIREAKAQVDANPLKSQAYQSLEADLEKANKGDSPTWDSLAAYVANAGGIPEQLAEGAWSTAKPIGATIATSIVPQTRALAPLATAGVSGYQGYESALSGLVQEEAQKVGIDLTRNPERISGLLSDPNFLSNAQAEAKRRGLSDAFFAFLSAKVGLNPNLSTGKQAVAQSGIGGATEAAGQIVQDGSITNPGAIIGATIGEAAFETPGYAIARIAQGKTAPAPAPAQQAAPAPAAQAQPSVADVVAPPQVVPGTGVVPPPAQQAAQAAPAVQPEATPAPAAEAAPAPVQAQPQAIPQVQANPRTDAEITPAQSPQAEATVAQPTQQPARSSFVAGLREDARKLRGQTEATQQPAAKPQQDQPAPAQQAQPQATAQPAQQAQPAQPAPQVRPSPQPTPAPGANRASFDPQADPRWGDLYGDQQSEIRSIVNQRNNRIRTRDRNSRQGRSTKQDEIQIGKMNDRIEAILATSQPKPPPAAPRPPRLETPRTPAQPVTQVDQKPEPEGITRARQEAAQLKEQISKLEQSGQGRSPQAQKLRSRFNLRKEDITSYERKNKLPLTYPPQPRKKASPAGADVADAEAMPAQADAASQAEAQAQPEANAQDDVAPEEDTTTPPEPQDTPVDEPDVTEDERRQIEEVEAVGAEAEAQADEPAHVASFREAYDNLRDDVEGAAQEQATADKLVNGKKGIVTRADALLEGAAGMDPKEFARQARELADSAESLADDQQEKADNIADAGRDDTFDGRESLIDGLNDLATNLRDAADKADPQAKPDAQAKPEVNPQQTPEAQLARIDKQLDMGIIDAARHAELKQQILGKGQTAQTVAQKLSDIEAEGQALIDQGKSDLRRSITGGMSGANGGNVLQALSDIAQGWVYKTAAKAGRASNLPSKAEALKTFLAEVGEKGRAEFDKAWEKLMALVGNSPEETAARLEKDRSETAGRTSVVGRDVTRVSAADLMSKPAPKIKGTGKGGKITIRDLARFFTERSKKVADSRKMDLSDRSPRSTKFIARVLIDEAIDALTRAKNAIGWYDSKVKEAFAEISQLHPELALDNDTPEGRQARFIFSACTAITSNGQDVRANFGRGEELYAKWKQTGRIEVDGSFGGKNAPAINKGLQIIQSLIDAKGIEAADAFLKAEFTVRELKAMGFKIAGENMDTKVKGANVLGPKIGSFFGNLNGDFSTVTMDRWFMRTFNRIRGVLTDPPDLKTLGKQVDRLRAAIEAANLDDVTKNDLLEDADRIKAQIEVGNFDYNAEVENPGPLLRFADERLDAYSAGGFKEKNELNQASQRFSESASINETPEGGSDRQYIRQVMADVQAGLRERGIDITNADLQALLWYNEKDLFKHLGVSNKRSESADYADAARFVVAERRKSGGGGNPPDGPGGLRPSQPSGPEGGSGDAPVPALGEAGRQDDRPVVTRVDGKEPVTKDGDVANHGKPGLAARGWITNFAAENLSDDMYWGGRLKVETNSNGDLYLTIDNGDKETIAGMRVTNNEDGTATVERVDVDYGSKGKGISKLLYAEAGERLKRVGVERLDGKVIDQDQRPIKSRERVFGKENTQITGEDRFTAEQTGGDPETHRWVETKIPNQYTPEQRQLMADIKKLVQEGKASPETIGQKVDEWAAKTLPKGQLLSVGPNHFAALVWQTARAIQKGGVAFASWSKQMVQTYGAKIKPFLKQIWADSQAIRRNAFDIATVRYLASRADKIWQNAARNPQSTTLRKLANLIHTKDGTDATGEISSIPARMREERIKFANAWARMIEPFAAEFAGMTKDQRRQWDEDFRDFVLGNRRPTDPKVAKAVAQYRQMMGELLAYQRAAGVEMGDRGGNYFPRVYSPEAIDADLPGFLAAAAEMYRRRDIRLGEPVKSQAEYDTMASQWAFRIQNGNVDDVQLNTAAVPEQSEMPSSSKPREFTDDEAELAAKFLSKDIDRVTLAYVGRATKAAEVARAFGPKGERFTQMIAQLQKEGVPLATIEETAGLVRRTLGYGIERISPLAASVIDWSNAMVAAGFLGFSFVNNVLLEPVSYTIRTGNPYLGLKAMADTWAGTLRILSRPSPAMNARIEKAFGTRIGMARSFNEAMAEQLGLLQREMEHSFLDAHWNYTEENGSPLARWVIQRTQRANLMQQTEAAKVAASVGIARLALRDNVRFMRGEAPIQKFFKKLGMDVTAPGSSAIILNENGVPAGEHQAFADFVMSLDGKSDADFEKAIMANDRMAFLYRQAVQRMSTGMSIKTNPALKMDSSDTAQGKFMMQLMNYSYGYANLVKDAMYNKALAAANPREQVTTLDRMRLAAPLMVGAPLTILAAEAGKQLVNQLWPTEGTEEREEMEDWRKVFDSASYAGMFGKKFEYLAKIVNRGQIPVGPALEAGGKALAAAGGITKGGEAPAKTAAKQAYNAGAKPIVVGGAAAVHPFLGFLANQAMRQQDVRNEFIEGVTGD